VTQPPVPTSSDDWTVRRVLDWTVEHLTKHGSDAPRLEAEVLLAHARGCQRIQLYTRYDERLGDDERATMRDLVKRRANHEPVAYLVGHREFFALDFRVTPDVLVPRPETETLVLESIERLRDHAGPRILDLCTGSGCVAVTLARQLPRAAIVAVDVSAAACAIARENAERHAVGARLVILEGDLFEPLEANDRFDAIVANPPYVTETEFETLAPDVRLHEPRLALVAGTDGLDIVRRILAASPSRLVPGGRVLLEVDPGQVDAVIELATGHGLVDVESVKDANGDRRVVIGTAST
jgi:release factor glutamine methyltransferase